MHAKGKVESGFAQCRGKALQSGRRVDHLRKRGRRMDKAAARQQFEALFSNSIKGLIALSVKDYVVWLDYAYEEIDEVLDFIGKLGEKEYFIAPCTFRLDHDGHFKRQADFACSMPGVWFDLDFQDPVHAKKTLPTREEAEGFIASLPLKPNLKIWSGHGFHLYWLFGERFAIETPEDRAKAQRLSRGFQGALIKEGAERGWVFDNTSDLARTLRLAGSINHKAQPPVEVKIVAHDPDLRYEFDELYDQYAAQEPNTAAFYGPGTREGETLDADSGRILEGCAFLRHCRDDAESLPEPEWYAMLSIIVRCEGGRERCHEFSKMYPHYSKEETDRKIDQALDASGPRTCEDIKTKFGCFCQGCPHEVTSPICLGTEKGQAAAYPLAIPEVAGSGEGQVIRLTPGLGIPTITIPPAWSVSEKGLIRWDGSGERKRPVPITPVPVYLVSRLVNGSSGVEFFTLAWPRDKVWKTIEVSRLDIADASRLLQHADKGLPVNSGNNRDLVEYFSELENLNLQNLPVTQASETLGWHETESGLGFVLGDRYISTDGTIIVDNGGNRVVFSPTSEGIEQLGRAFSCKGDFSAWLEIVEKIRAFPIPLLTLFVALASPLLKIMEVPGFALDLAYTTSSGKTTCQRIAISAFGCPIETSPQAAIFSWNATRVSIERTAGTLNGLPITMNDSKQAKKKDEVVQAIYDIANGQGKGRGSKQGLQKRVAIQSTLISSGEEPIVDGSEAGGLRARTLSIFEPPFGSADQAILVNEINKALSDHYGHGGAAFLAYVLRNRDQWATWQKDLAEIQTHYAEKAAGNPFVGRLAQPLALIDLTARLASEAWGLAELLPSPVEALWSVLTKETGEADRSKEALEYVVGVCMANQSRFWQKGSNIPQYSAEFWGRWDRNCTDWTAIAILPPQLKEILVKGGFEAKTIRRTWLQKEWLDGDKDRTEVKTVLIGADKLKTRCVAIKREVLEKLQLLGQGEEERGLGEASTFSSADTEAKKQTSCRELDSEASYEEMIDPLFSDEAE